MECKEKCEYYIWSQEPYLNSLPDKRVKYHFSMSPDKDVQESAVYLLESGKFLYVNFCGSHTEELTGVTYLEEFSSLNDAVEVFEKSK